MDEVEGSIPSSSTLCAFSRTLSAVGHGLAGLAAGEGCFTEGTIGERRDGSARHRFRFQVTMADRDLPMLDALRHFTGVGSILRRGPQRPGWQPTATHSVGGRRGIREAVIPFFATFLIASAKRRHYERWRDRFHQYESLFPSKWGVGPSPCAITGCDAPVRGRGLCRVHYYRETGY